MLIFLYLREYQKKKMKAIIYISGIIGEETTLTDVIRQFKSYDEPTEVEAKIHSEGGNVEQGDAICDFLNGLKKTMTVNTSATKAYSIAAKIFSVGEERIVEDAEKAIMIHFAWAEVKGKAEKLELVAEALREMENDFASYYSEFLAVDEDTARSLLDNDTFISGSEAVELGFATGLKSATKAVAKYDSIINLKTSKMSKKSKGKQLLAAFAAFVGLEDADANALVLQDSSGTEIDFSELESGDVPKVGDAGTIDGDPVPDGEYIMPSLEDAKVVFVDGKISEINEAEEVEETEEEIQARLDAKAEEVQQISVWEQTASNTSFEVGDVMTYDYDGETYNFGAGEFFVPSIDKNVVTDASGVIVAHKDKVVTSTEQVDDEAEVSAQLEGMLEKVENKISAKYEAKFEEQAKKINTLNKLVGSKEFKAEEIEPDGNEGSKKNAGNYMANVLRKKRS